MKNLVFIFLLIPFTLIAQRNVSGKITDANDNAPVAGASVFISNTTIGAFTDAEGHYQLKIPEEGAYKLTISYIGYQTVIKDIEPGNTPVEFNAALRIQEKELEEVSVVEKVRFRQRDIDLFWKTILGESPSRNAIWVANPEAVYYYYNQETRILKVTCREPLQIFNFETGYQIHYVLNNFTYDYNKNITDWSNQFVFSQLVPEDRKQDNNWEKKRRKVYNASLTKFIKSLYNNTLYEDGFVLASLQQNREPNNPYQISLIQPGSILSEKSDDNSKTFDLSSAQVMLVCYGRSVNANDLDIIQHPQDKEFVKKSSGLLMNLLQGESIRIFPDGTYANKLLMAPVNSSNTLLGLNMRLPFEYRPDEQMPLIANNENVVKFNENKQAVHLKEVAVTKRKKENKEEPRLKFWANASSDVTIRREKIEKMHPQSISDILRTIPGVTVKNGTVNIRQSMSLYSGTAPLVFINGTEAGEAMSANSPLESISVADVESIDVFIGSGTSVFGVRGANGVISITTREKINQ